MPTHTKLKDAKGNTVSSRQRPEVLADHFEKVQWSCGEPANNKEQTDETTTPTSDQGTPNTPDKHTSPLTTQAPKKRTKTEDTNIHPTQNPITEFPNNMRNRARPKLHDHASYINTNKFTDEELQAVPHKAKRNKSPGPNEIPALFFTFLTTEARLEIQELLNEI